MVRASRPGHFTLGARAPGIHWIGGWMDLRSGPDDVEKRKFLTLPGLEIQPLASCYLGSWSEIKLYI
jgi:hypothetical protein